MGMLENGTWKVAPIVKTNTKGSFVRLDSVFQHTISKDGSSGFKAEPNRYHLYVSYACPWASRAIIFRTLKGLEKVISMSVVEPLMLDNGWEFGKTGSETEDPIFHLKYLYELYQKADSNHTGKVTVPVLWDKVNHTIVNNESSQIIRILNSEFNDFAQNQSDYYPESQRKEIDSLNSLIYDNINNGVYKCGFASSQTAYEEAFDNLFLALDKIEGILSTKRYLAGENITEADWRLFTTLIRFDIVYYVHFKCNLNRIVDYPNLFNYLKELYQYPGIKETVNFEHIKQHYYGSHKFINPSGLVPKGPKIDFDAPHNRLCIANHE
jgi:glutathionyl-hydroquinone reductase